MSGSLQASDHPPTASVLAVRCTAPIATVTTAASLTWPRNSGVGFWVSRGVMLTSGASVSTVSWKGWERRPLRLRFASTTWAL